MSVLTKLIVSLKHSFLAILMHFFLEVFSAQFPCVCVCVHLSLYCAQAGHKLGKPLAAHTTLSSNISLCVAVLMSCTFDSASLPENCWKQALNSKKHRRDHQWCNRLNTLCNHNDYRDWLPLSWAPARSETQTKINKHTQITKLLR